MFARRELAAHGVEAPVRKQPFELGHDRKHRLLSVERDTSIMLLHVDVISHQVSKRAEIFGVVSRNPAIGDSNRITHDLGLLIIHGQR